jgi:tetratricopeptide (TPR) repeat protein
MNSPDAATGMQLAQQGRYAEALPYLENANRHAPADVPLLHATASLLQGAGRPMDAVERYRIASTLLPDNTEVLTGWARALLLIGEEAVAVEPLDRALTLDPRFADPGGLLSMLWDADAPDVACKILRQLAARHPSNANLMCQYAQALHAAEHLEDAQLAWERYAALRPDDPMASVELGRLAASRGDSMSAKEHFKAALRVDPHCARALSELAHAEPGPLDQQVLAQVSALAESDPDPVNAASLNDALARHHHRIGDFRAAAFHLMRMNLLQERLTPEPQRYNQRQHELENDVAIRNYTPHLFHRLRDAGSADHRPVFVIGLPRSGTTLLERMLASHPEMIGIGEQSFARSSFQRALAASGGLQEMLSANAVGTAAAWHLSMLEDRVQRLGIVRSGTRIVDKLPDNYLLAGWLRIAFPNAAIIHCLRDPRDVALSCWQTPFSKIQWAFRLDDIAHRIEQHRRLMRYWHSTIGGYLTELRYEHLVAEPENEMRRILAATGLDWHPDVLAHSDREGYVGSASRHQVREPLHARSVARWRNYEEALQPILPRLNAIAAQDALEATAYTAL